MSHELKLSLCIATYNGAHKIPQTLFAVLQNTKRPDEVVIYVDGSEDNTIEVLETFQDQLPLKIISGENVGRAAARNKALMKCTSDIVMFIDDDIIIPFNSIQKHFDFHHVVQNGILTAPSFTIPNKYDFSYFKEFLEHKWNSIARLDRNNLAFSAACFSILKSNMIQIGGFLNGLNDAEDYEFGIRARKNDIKIEVDHEIWAKHNDDINCRSFINRNRQYFEANEKLLDEKIIEESQYVNKKHPFYKKWVFYFLASKFLVNLIDSNFFIFLYKPIRYKLYNYVTAGFIHYYPKKTI